MIRGILGSRQPPEATPRPGRWSWAARTSGSPERRDCCSSSRGGRGAVGQGDDVIAVLIGGAHGGSTQQLVRKPPGSPSTSRLGRKSRLVDANGQPPLALDHDVALLRRQFIQISAPQVPLTNAPESITPLRIPVHLVGVTELAAARSRSGLRAQHRSLRQHGPRQPPCGVFSIIWLVRPSRL